MLADDGIRVIGTDLKKVRVTIFPAPLALQNCNKEPNVQACWLTMASAKLLSIINEVRVCHS
jgi:hypothetical protein